MTSGPPRPGLGRSAAILWLLPGALVWRWWQPSFAFSPLSAGTDGSLRSRGGSSLAEGSRPGCRGSGRQSPAVLRAALRPLLRRDPYVNKEMQLWMNQQSRLYKRQAGLREKDNVDQAKKRKAAYLAKLGLADKAKEVEESMQKPWHLDHLVEGDVLEGSFFHPSIEQGNPVDVKITITSPTSGMWTSRKADIEGDVDIEQDFPIVFEKGEAREEAMVTYIFNKYNMDWRSFEKPVPKQEEMEHLTLQGLRIMFKNVADVDEFPPESDFLEAVADPTKGMTKEEFKKFILDEDPNYLESSFPNVFTGRRIRFGDEELLLDGDFQAETEGVITGFVFARGTGGGDFRLKLIK